MTAPLIMHSLTNQLRALLIFAALLLISACSNLANKDLPKAASEQAWQQHQQQLANINSWLIQGKLAIRNSEQSGSANLNWQQQQQNFDIHLSGPLGQGAVRLSGNPQLLKISSSKHTETATSPQQLMQEQLGWSIPLDNLYWWVRGLAAPNGKKYLTLDSYSRLQTLEQTGWQLEYLDYQLLENGLYLPKRIRASGEDLQLLLVIKSWHINNN